MILVTVLHLHYFRLLILNLPLHSRLILLKLHDRPLVFLTLLLEKMVETFRQFHIQKLTDQIIFIRSVGLTAHKHFLESSQILLEIIHALKLVVVQFLLDTLVMVVHQVCQFRLVFSLIISGQLFVFVLHFVGEGIQFLVHSFSHSLLPETIDSGVSQVRIQRL
jgi:hypothetical protein